MSNEYLSNGLPIYHCKIIRTFSTNIEARDLNWSELLWTFMD
jgi:hypothetical protein